MAAAALCAALWAAPVEAQSRLCDRFPNLPGCGGGGGGDCNCEDLDARITVIEQGQVAQNAAIASLASQIATIHGDIADLQACCTDTQATITGLQDQIDEIVNYLGGDCTVSGLDDCSGNCVDLDTNHENCGTCGNACNANQDCVSGECEFHVCPDPGECQLAVLNEDGSCSNVPLTGDACDDGLQCTTQDSCLNGTCVGGGNPCDAGETCVEGTGNPPDCVGGAG
jgi:hypothetical protein